MKNLATDLQATNTLPSKKKNTHTLKPIKMAATKMKAIIATGYGGPKILKLQEVDKPIPKDNEVLIKIKAAAVTRADTMMRTGYPLIGRLVMGLRKPKHPIPGTGFAGEVVEIGEKVTLFQKGDPIFGESIEIFGTYAQYICLKEEGILLKKPSNITYEEAAGICDGALTSISFLKDIITLQPGQTILINGASGSLGTAAVQLAKLFGARVTGVCSTKNLALVRSLGADEVIDYTMTDFTKTGEQYDIIFDTVGKRSFSACKDSLTQNGSYLSPVFGMTNLFQMLWTTIIGGKQAKFSATGARPVFALKLLFQELKELIEKGQLKSIMDKKYSLEQIVVAQTYIDKGHKKGNVTVTIVH